MERPLDVFWGYALELIVSALRGLRFALGRLIGDDEGDVMRPAAASGAPAPPRNRPPDAQTLRRALATVPPLPASYGDDRLVLVARDPGTLFVSWDLPAGVERPAGAVDARFVLRIEDLTLLDFAEARAWRHHDVEVEGAAGSQYVRRARPEGTYCAELGWRGADGTFVARIRSAVTTTPRAEAPGHDPTRWMTVRVEHTPLGHASADATTRLSVRLSPAPSAAPGAAWITHNAARRSPSSEERHRRDG
ncbi:MAG: DUF4912 domain-containing protein [Deltaproteobacteria bacterium]|nr:DUF4912 domain-containing protein [Deltaproteobacteria bacterium]